VRTAPDGIDERELSAALEDYWGFAPAWLGYLPVGFGDHHWELTDSAGHRWFVTLAGLTSGWRGTDPAAGYADLRAAMDTVIALAGAGLEFAVAPVPTTGGQALARLGDAHAITVFPYLDGAGEDLGDETPGRERLALIEMLARLHNATPQARRTAPVRRLDLTARPVLEAALGELSQPWNGGPYSEPARQLLARHASHLDRALASFDELAREAARSGPPVLTHGEPHNILRSAGRLYLIDWDTVGLALPERDLWSVADADSREADRYARPLCRTHRPPRQHRRDAHVSDALEPGGDHARPERVPRPTRPQ
jgi:spectinomycin phosphotransferase